MNNGKENNEKFDQLKEILPSGSGVDYEWTFRENSKFIYAENAFHYMNEDGFYDGTLPFTLRIPKNDVMNFKLTFSVNGAGRYRVNKGGIREYIESIVSYSLSYQK